MTISNLSSNLNAARTNVILGGLKQISKGCITEAYSNCCSATIAATCFPACPTSK
jgi:hypothetical protein